MKEFFTYIKNPTHCEERKIDWGMFVKLYLFNLFSGWILGGFFFLLCSLLGVPTENLLSNIVKEGTWWKVLLFGIVFAPIFEEILFRLLLRFSKRNLLVFFGGLIINIIGDIYDGFFESASVYVIIVGLVFLLWKTKVYQKIPFSVFFYFSCVAFGLVHMANFEEIHWLTPLLIVPQLIAGFVLGFVRMNYGFRYSILLHMCVNSLLVFSVLFSLLHK